MMRKLFVAAFASALFTFAVAAQPEPSGSNGSTAETPKKPAVFRPTKDQIKQVQTILKGKKLYSGEESGKYNDETRDGIKSFQKDNGLKETGTLNRATLEKFGVELTDSQKLIPVSESSYASKEPEKTEKPAKTVKTASTTETKATATDKPKKPAVFRATKDQIKETQKLLKAKSMYSGEETGKLDDATRDGLKKYQEANELKVTGTLNQVTLEKMGIALTESQKASAAATKN